MGRQRVAVPGAPDHAGVSMERWNSATVPQVAAMHCTREKTYDRHSPPLTRYHLVQAFVCIPRRRGPGGQQQPLPPNSIVPSGFSYFTTLDPRAIVPSFRA